MEGKPLLFSLSGAPVQASPDTANRRHRPDAPSSLVKEPPATDSMASKPARLTGDLKPTSADFKPRMGIGLKLPLVEFKPSGIEFNPPHTTFAANQSSSDRGLGSATRGVLTQHDTGHAFQSNRAIPDQGFQFLSQTSGNQDDTVHLDRLHAADRRNDINPASYVTGDRRVLEEHPKASDAPKQLSSSEDSHKTPNVYINGLPPHFPEEQLYALAAPFGEVKSVRTFTRHVRDSESGYGFVLYVLVR